MATINVLIVEDDPFIQRFYRSIFAGPAGRRYSPLIVPDAPQALAALDAGRFELAVLDWGLPRGDGASLARELRSRAGTRDVGILMVTGRRSGADTIQALKSGADDHLPKPFDPDMLLMRLNALIRRRQLGAPRWAGSERPLTILERNLLQVFLHSPVRLSKEELARMLWGGEGLRPAALEPALDSLRKKLGPAWAERLQTV